MNSLIIQQHPDNNILHDMNGLELTQKILLLHEGNGSCICSPTSRLWARSVHRFALARPMRRLKCRSDGTKVAAEIDRIPNLRRVVRRCFPGRRYPVD